MFIKCFRISDKGRETEKISYCSKIYCLENCIYEFGLEDFILIADNCKDETIEEIKKKGINPIITNLGNAGSFQFAVEYIIKNYKENDFVYFIEDDYLHKPYSKKVLIEGLEIADYVTLYDHPDKYTSYKNAGDNPYIIRGGEVSSVFVTKNSHWKTTNSTTMTFATKVLTLKEDKKIFWYYTKNKLPNDFGIFASLTQQSIIPVIFSGRYYRTILSMIYSRLSLRKKRYLINSIPAYSTHVDCKHLSPLVDWKE